MMKIEKHYDFQSVEPKMQSFWQENSIYKFIPDGRQTFSIDTPPPTISGSLHIGHIFSYTQAEIIARYKRMRGYNVFYPFGFDDNGLPTERLVEKKEKIRARKISRKDFIERCMKVTDYYEQEFQDLWTSMGFSVDWSLKYKTIGPRAQKISQKAFIDLAKQNKAYIKESPVFWCTECQTSIAQAELESKVLQSTFNYLHFNVEGTLVPVATTRPELLFSCVCLFVNPSDQDHSWMIGHKATVPLYNFDIPILSDCKVDVNKGSGVVMCATFGDSTDVDWVTEYNLPCKNIITAYGTVANNVPFIGGLQLKEARQKIIELLTEKGYLIKSVSINHNVATHERCGTAIEIIPSKQWYIDVLSQKAELIEAADKIKWHPSYMKSRYINWVSNLQWDWCISRQRYFGVPFPVWYCKRCGKPIFAEDNELPVNPVVTPCNKTCTCGCTEFIPESAVLDTWATSSLSPLINARYGEKTNYTKEILPMSLRTQAHEIIRTWAFYTIVRSLYHTKMLPWSEIMISGFVLAKPGEKISKSKKNSAYSPELLIKNNSADALRYWAANAKLGTDTFFSESELKLAKRFITKLWNASKFALEFLDEYTPLDLQSLLPIDRWIIEKTNQTILQAEGYLDEYEIGDARHVVDDLFWKDFCDNYIELIKPRLYNSDINSLNYKSAQNGLYYALLNIIKMYAIYVPHITEYIYQSFFAKYEMQDSLHLCLWSDFTTPAQAYIQFGENIKTVLAAIRKFKTENGLSMRTEIAEYKIEVEQRVYPLMMSALSDIKDCMQIKNLTITKANS